MFFTSTEELLDFLVKDSELLDLLAMDSNSRGELFDLLFLSASSDSLLFRAEDFVF